MQIARNSTPPVSYILKRIADDKALTLFNSIAVSNGEGIISIREMNLTTKQYYSRISGLLNAGLVKRHKGKHSLTLLGKVVYNSQIAIGKALNYYWKLQALESIQTSSSPALPKEELSKLIDTLIDNHEIKDILMESISLSSTENNSKVVISTAVIEQSRRMSVAES
jgi:predicted transcriptional regulator